MKEKLVKSSVTMSFYSGVSRGLSCLQQEKIKTPNRSSRLQSLA